ncbi:MAG: Uma2 family endonuclease [Geitlerinemataceae cyanobacterium]
MTVAIAKWSVEEYMRLVATGLLDEKPVELLAGDLISMAPEGALHSECIDGGAEALREVIPQELKVREAHPIALPESVPEPDIAVVVRGKYRDRLPNAAETKIVIEVAMSSLGKDLQVKRSLYAKAGIPEYWVVDISGAEAEHRVVVLTEPQDGDYSREVVLTEGMVRSRVLPTVAVPVSVLLGN